MSEDLSRYRRILQRLSTAIVFFWITFHGNSTDMNVHPTDNPAGIDVQLTGQQEQEDAPQKMTMTVHGCC